MKQLLSKHKDKIQKILFVLVACIATYGVNYVSALASGSLLSNGIASVAVFVGIYLILKLGISQFFELKDIKARKRRFIYAFSIAMLFSVLLIWGYQLKMNGATDPGFKGKGLAIIRGACLALAVWPFTNYLFAWIEKIRDGKTVESTTKIWKGKYIFFINWLVIFACWIPVFLAYYPAIMSYDFHRQSIEAVKGFIWFNSYQPLAHTWLIWLFLTIGESLGSYQTGMALYSIFQMLVFSAACAYSCSVVYRLLKKKIVVIGMGVFFGLFPLISVLAIATTKDIFFSALFLVFLCLFVERTFLSDRKRQLVMDILWVVVGIVMFLFRNNAVYALAVFSVIYVILAVKKQRLRILAVCLALILGGIGALEGMYIVIGTEGRGSKVEMFSVPIQQFGRVARHHVHELDAESFELINKYVPEEFWGNYNPPISDGLKALVGAYIFADVWEESYTDMLSAWAKIGLKYPNTYIDAFLELTAGYWFFDDVTWAEVLGYGLEGRMGAVYTFTSSTSDEIPDGIAHETKFPALELTLEKIVSANQFYHWPVISNLFKPAFYCWILLLSSIATIYMKKRKKLLVTLIPLVYLGTLLLGPVVQIRYVLPLIVTTPLLLAMLVSHKEHEG